MALFLDTFVNKLDRKGRVSVPATYRQQLAGQSFQGIVALPSFKQRAVQCGGIDWMAGIEKDLGRINLFSDEHDDLSITMFSDAKQLAFDGEGRIVLAPSLIEHAGLGDLAAFVGRGSIFEIWEPSALDSYKAEARRRALEAGRTLPRADNDRAENTR
jgi:MraZ protein